MVAKKEDYEKIFNKILGTDIRWSKLTLEDLVTLATIFNSPEILISRLGGKIEKEVTRKRLVDVGMEILDEIADKWEGPLALLYKRLVGKEKTKD